MLVAPRWGNSAVDLLYLPAVLAVAGHTALGLRSSPRSLPRLPINYFFTAPLHTLRIASPQDVVTVVVLFLVALVTSQLAAGIRKQAQLAKGHAARNATIAGLARRLLSGTSEQAIAEISVAELASLYRCNAILVSGQPKPAVLAALPAYRLTPSDLAAAAMVLASGKAAGRGLQPATPIEWQFHPIQSDSQTIAAIGLARDDGVPAVDEDHLALLGSLLDQIALALDRARLEREARDFTALPNAIGSGPPCSPRSARILTRRSPRLPGRSASFAATDRPIASSSLRSAPKRPGFNVISPTCLNWTRRPIANRSRSGASGSTCSIARYLATAVQIRLTPKEYALLAELASMRGEFSRILTF